MAVSTYYKFFEKSHFIEYRLSIWKILSTQSQIQV